MPKFEVRLFKYINCVCVVGERGKRVGVGVLALMRMDTASRGVNSCEDRFTSLLKKGLLLKEKQLLPWSKFFPFRVDLFLEGA